MKENNFKNMKMRKGSLNTPVTRLELKIPKVSNECSGLFDNIEQEINNTLSAFINERQKQATAIKNAKQELKSLTSRTPAGSERKRAEDKVYMKNKYIAYIKAQENQLKKLEKELVYTKENLKTKEDELTYSLQVNKKLSNEIRFLRAQNYGDDPIKKKLMDVVTGKISDEYFGLNFGNPAELLTEKLIENIEKLLKYLIEERENMELKYTKLFDLHSKQIEINSKQNFSETIDGQSEL